MDISKFLSKVLGLYLIIISIVMLINMQQFASYISSLISDAPLIFVTGFFTLILGLLMVVSHNVWQWNWRVIITIISWIVLLKGISILFFPQFMNKISILFIQNMSFAYIAPCFDFAIGVLLSYFGFKR